MDTGSGDRVTYAEAAALLGCHVSNVPKLIRRGLLTSHGGRGTKGGTLDRREVEALAERRKAEREARDSRAPTSRAADRRPDGNHDWLTVAQVAQLVGLSEVGVRKRIARERVPAVRHRGRWWIRRDLLEQVEAARLVTRTRRI